MKDKTIIWHEKKGKRSVRIQTNNINIHLKLLRREEFEFVGEGLNISLWIHRCESLPIEKIQNMLRRLVKNS
jgi:hypothetical protein